MDIELLHNNIISKYNIVGGSFSDELIEQYFCIKYVNPDNNILEIGGNIGRVSIIISHVLKNGIGKLVTLETNKEFYDILLENKNNNKLDFVTLNKALSNQPISQILHGNNWCSYPTNLIFDTLVIDCEGAFYFILKDFPDILDNIKLIIIENDCMDEYQNTFILETFKNSGFNLVESKTLDVAWGSCKDYFWQVWKR
jgi:hypothetical protein